MTPGSRLIALASLPVAAIALASGAASLASTAKPAHILEFQYSVDTEGLSGHHRDAAAIVKGVPDRVRARLGDEVAEGRLSRRISPSGPGKLWFFREHAFVKALRADLEADGFARVAVRATGAARKRCELELEPDPVFGDFAGGKCRRPGN